MKIKYFQDVSSGNQRGSLLLVQRWFMAIFIGLTIFLAAQFWWTVRDMKEVAFQQALIKAKSIFEKDFSYRRWAASFGGVYVPISEKIIPNQYLVIPERDIETITGKKLTRINPAYMTRLVNESYQNESTDTHVHITSLKLLNPNNEADDWEKTSLLAFANGESEVAELAMFRGSLHLRLMRPLFVEKNCLTCHIKQGYKIGDLRGGISVSVPFDEYMAMVQKNKFANFIWNSATWLLFVLCLLVGRQALIKAIINRDAAEASAIDTNLRLTRQLNENKLLENRLRQAEKMESIGTLAGGIAHDFNNILSAIFGFTDLTIRSLPTESPFIGDLKQVMKAAERARDLVKQILSFSRQNKGEPIPMQLSVNVKEVLKMMRSSLPATIEIIQSIDEGPNYIYADPTQIHQIVMNLCTNAAQAMSQTGGELIVTLKKVVIDKIDFCKHPGVKIGEYMLLSVCDSGVGIDPDIKEKIFEPYFTTKGVGEGTGMGLAIVHGIVSSYGGFIDVCSEPDKGASFNVHLPIWNGGDIMKNELVESIIAGKERILFIDDEVPIVDLTSQALRGAGYDVVGMVSSLEALEMFKKDPGAFDLVITDQAMPKLSGVELIKKMIEIRSDIPIILSTGFSSVISEDSAGSLGFRRFITKPISMVDLSKIIREVLDEKKQ